MKFRSAAGVRARKSSSIAAQAAIASLALILTTLPAGADNLPAATEQPNTTVTLQAIAPNTAREDNSSPTPANMPSTTSTTSTTNSALQGGILLEESAAAPDSSNPMASSTAVSEQALAGQQPSLDSATLPRRSLFGFSSKPWTTEQYRKLDYGVLGIVAQKNVFSRFYTITEVLPGCPAALAGLQRGDIEISANGHVFTAQDDQRSYWRTVAGKAGTPVDIVVRRNGELINFHLVRMNIEDIENDRVRRLFERMLSSLGPPSN